MENQKSEWHNSDAMLEVYAAFEAGKPEYPVVCPECGQKRAHIYFNRFEETSRGGVWAWCSECHAFDHGSSIVPEWWSNHSCVNQENLCAADPIELADNEEALDEHVNSQILRYCMLDNACDYCLHKKMQNPKLDICPECGKQTWMATLDGPCMLVTCSSCGLKVVGASFFPPCHNDDLDYTFIVSDIPKEKKIKAAKLFNMTALDLLNEITEKGKIERTFKLNEAEKIFVELRNLEISFEMTPDLLAKYPELIGCKYF